ncbi:MAG: glycosyltransferase [Candidatus Korobacteraceae bacterium]
MEAFGFPASNGAVLHVLDHSWPVLSGYSIRSRNLIASQHRLGQAIVVITGPLHQVDDPDAADTVLDGVDYRRTLVAGTLERSAVQRRWPVLREWVTVRCLRDRILELIDSQPVSIVYAHSPALCGLAGLQAARRRGLPFVYEIRAFWEDAAVDQRRTRTTSLRYRLARALEDYVAGRADAVAVIAQPMLAELRARGVPGEKLFHVPNGVDADRLTPLARDTQLANELGLDGSPVFGFFGSLYRYEGVAWLIRAAAELYSRGNRFQLLIIGSGEDAGPIGNAIREHGAEGYTRLIDRVPHEDIRRYYSVVDVMVFPRLSVRLTEMVTPLKPLEAMSLKKAVLASDVGGHRELVEHENTGLLFRSEDVADFCVQAERLTSQPELRQQLGERGREMVLRDKDWKVLARRYQAIYEFVSKQRGNAAKLMTQSVAGSCNT